MHSVLLSRLGTEYSHLTHSATWEQLLNIHVAKTKAKLVFSTEPFVQILKNGVRISYAQVWKLFALKPYAYEWIDILPIKGKVISIEWLRSSCQDI